MEHETKTQAKLPTQEALDWATETLVPKSQHNNITITKNPASVSGNPTALMSTPHKTFFIKQLTPHWDHQIESTITKILSPHPATLTYITDNPHHRIIVTEYIKSYSPSNSTTSPPTKNWTITKYVEALNALTEIQEILASSPTASTLNLPIMNEIPSNRLHSLHGLRLIESTQYPRHGLHFLYPNFQTKQELAHSIRNALIEINNKHSKNLTPQHTDATPENWVFSSQKDAPPILIDYGTYALAPHYWDKNIFTITAPLPPQQKIFYTFTSKKNIQELSTTALYFLLYF
jgi:thiamine kinase-like enzyme